MNTHRLHASSSFRPWWPLFAALIAGTTVVVGGRVPGKVMLKDGLKAGERIVTEGVGKLQAGSRVAEGGAKAAPAEAAAK